MPPHRPWPRRFIQAFPPMPDGLWVGFFCVMVFLLGVTVGLNLRMPFSLPTVPDRPSLQQQLDSLDARVKALEAQETP